MCYGKGIDFHKIRDYIKGMDPATKAFLYEQGGKVLSAVWRAVSNRPRPRKSEETTQEAKFVVAAPAKTEVKSESTPVATTAVPKSKPALPTSEETTKELKRRLARELYKAELDLTGGLKIAGKACDCLQDKHALGIDATTEELISQDPRDRIYYEIREWMERIQPIVTIEAINSGEYAQEYPILANEAKTFRKRLLGTESISVMAREAPTITLEDAKKLAAAEASREIERQWNSQKTK